MCSILFSWENIPYPFCFLHTLLLLLFLVLAFTSLMLFQVSYTTREALGSQTYSNSNNYYDNVPGTGRLLIYCKSNTYLQLFRCIWIRLCRRSRHAAPFPYQVPGTGRCPSHLTVEKNHIHAVSQVVLCESLLGLGNQGVEWARPIQRHHRRWKQQGKHLPPPGTSFHQVELIARGQRHLIVRPICHTF